MVAGRADIALQPLNQSLGTGSVNVKAQGRSLCQANAGAGPINLISYRRGKDRHLSSC